MLVVKYMNHENWVKVLIRRLASCKGDITCNYYTGYSLKSWPHAPKRRLLASLTHPPFSPVTSIGVFELYYISLPMGKSYINNGRKILLMAFGEGGNHCM